MTDIPGSVAELTPEFFTRALDRDVTTVTVLDQHTGTTGRARVALSGEPTVPHSVFVKLAPFTSEQRTMVDATGMGVAEARFYREVASELPVRVPRVHHAATDGHAYVMVLEDIVASGCTFPRPKDPQAAARALDIARQMAVLHAAYWESDRFAGASNGDLAWIADRSAVRDDGGRGLVEQALTMFGAEMGDSFVRVAEFYLEHTDAIRALLRSGPRTLTHGDAHLRNLFVDPALGDRTGFLDWACVGTGPGIADVAYVLTSSVPRELCATIEADIVQTYCDDLGAQGIASTFEETWTLYRAHTFTPWVACAVSAAMGSKWQPSAVALNATRFATAACTDLDGIGAVRSLLA
ncbi:MAG: aminoglycoside phosphotransferase family protein [Acidimicrobiia bacterium]